MEEIQVNEYVRTENGLIGKVNKIEIAGSGCRFSGEFFTDTIIQFNDGKVYERRVKSKQVKKHSKNIKKLIEEGDIIELDGEKYQVIYDKSYNKLGILIPNKDYLEIRHIALEYILQKNSIIKIITHEQFENNCYTI